MIGAYPARATVPEVWLHPVRLLGTGAAAPTKELGNGIAVTRTAEGVYKLTWSENPGVFVGLVGHVFGDATPADVKGHTLTRDTYDATAYSIEVSVWDSVFAADDLDATEYLDLLFAFKRTATV